MEKRTAHYPLKKVKELVSEGRYYATRVALSGAAELGFNLLDMTTVIGYLEVEDLYKSMTSNSDHTIWQDVYHYPAEQTDIYIKIQIVEQVVIVSFKEL